MHSTTSSPSALLPPISRGSSAVVCSVSLADTKQRKRGRRKRHIWPARRWCVRRGGWKRPFIDQIIPGGRNWQWQRHLLSLGLWTWSSRLPTVTHSQRRAEYRPELHCVRQLDLTGGNMMGTACWVRGSRCTGSLLPRRQVVFSPP